MKYLTTFEAASMLGISLRTLYRYLDKGYFPFVQPVHKILILESDLLDFINK